MKYSWCLLLLVIGIQLCNVYSHHPNRRSKHRRSYSRHGKKAALLPPPSSDSKEKIDDVRGLRGQIQPLANLQKSHAKCVVEGSYGIRGECHKYIECKKAGLIPSSRFCPSGKFFDHLERRCLSSSIATCKDVCKEEGEMIKDPYNTHGYLKCIKMVPMPYDCENTEDIFIFERQECVLDDEAAESDEDVVSDDEAAENNEDVVSDEEDAEKVDAETEDE